MKHIAKLIMLLGIVLCCCCSNSHRNNHPDNKNDNSYRIQDIYDKDGTSPDIPTQRKNSTYPSINEHTIGKYEEGLIDGEAAAEEDRLAGRPGMQIGDDDGDDDEDYEDGYDDEYDE